MKGSGVAEQIIGVADFSLRQTACDAAVNQIDGRPLILFYIALEPIEAVSAILDFLSPRYGVQPLPIFFG